MSCALGSSPLARTMTQGFRRFCGHPLFLGFLLLAAKSAWEYGTGPDLLGDSFQAYAFFNTCLGNLLAAGEFPLWLPHAAWGIPAGSYALTFLGPFQVLAALIAAALKITDAWPPFFCSVLLDLAVFVVSAYLLARECYEEYAPRLAVTLGAVLMTYWQAQYFWPHKMILHLPLILFLLLRFFREGQAARLWQAGVAALAFLSGNLAYTAPILAMLGLVFMAGLALFSGAWPRLRLAGLLSRPSVLWFLILAALAACYAHLLAASLEGVVILAPGRGPGGVVPLDAFLDYGYPALARLPDFFLGQPVADLEMNVFVGIAASALAGLAWTRPRSPVLKALGLLTLFLLLLSLGRAGLVAYGAYHFPLADRFRHLGHLLPLVRVLLLFLAGFGLEALARDPDRKRAWRNGALFALAAILVFAGAKWGLYRHLIPQSGLNLAPETGAALLVLGLLAAAWRRLGGRSLALVFGLVLTVELALSQLALDRELRPLLASDPSGGVHLSGLDLRTARAPAFHPLRLADPATEPRWQGLADLALYRWPVNTTLFEFLGLDPCLPLLRTDFLCQTVADRGGPGLLAALAAVNQEMDPRVLLSGRHWAAFRAEEAFLSASGCGFPKLTLWTGPPSSPPRDLGPDINHFSANRLVLAVEHANPAGATLAYGDAFHPGWKAFVDGRAVPLARAEGAFKALFVPPGRHRVEFVFGQASDRLEIPVLGLGLAAALLLIQGAALKGPRNRERAA